MQMDETVGIASHQLPNGISYPRDLFVRAGYPWSRSDAGRICGSYHTWYIHVRCRGSWSIDNPAGGGIQATNVSIINTAASDGVVSFVIPDPDGSNNQNLSGDFDTATDLGAGNDSEVLLNMTSEQERVLRELAELDQDPHVYNVSAISTGATILWKNASRAGCCLDE